jgi:prepilin-type N-terminal cleavage/methylation domain-containing protein
MFRHIERAAKAGRSKRAGFSMIELVIVVVIIGIIAAIAIPRMSRGTSAAADAAVSQNLQILRNAVDLYQTEHGGTFPVAAGAVTVVDLLTKYSNVTGDAVSATKDTGTAQLIYGPYLRSVPSITVGTEKGKNGIGAAAATGIAWIYDPTAGTVTANAGALVDGAGKAYSSY